MGVLMNYRLKKLYQWPLISFLKKMLEPKNYSKTDRKNNMTIGEILARDDVEDHTNILSFIFTLKTSTQGSHFQLFQ